MRRRAGGAGGASARLGTHHKRPLGDGGNPAADWATTRDVWPLCCTIWATTNLRPGTPAKKRKKRNLEVLGFLPFYLNSHENGWFWGYGNEFWGPGVV